jgi:hypothetical protein
MPQPTVSRRLRALREAGFVESTVDAQRRLYRLKTDPLQEVDAWLAPFRRFWSAHVDALERHLDRMDQSTPTNGSLGKVGTTIKLTTVGAPTPQVSETTVTRADAPKVLEYNWGGFDIRWELEAIGAGTRLTLWHNIVGRIVGGEAMKFGGWQRLNAEYALFSCEPAVDPLSDSIFCR